jgi:hypothetical protein
MIVYTRTLWQRIAGASFFKASPKSSLKLKLFMRSKEAGTSVGEPPIEDRVDGEVIVLDGNIIADGVRRALKSRHLQMIVLGGMHRKRSMPRVMLFATQDLSEL